MSDNAKHEVIREWLTYKEAEQLTSLSRTTLYKLMLSGKVRGVKVRKAVRINKKSLEEYMNYGAENIGNPRPIEDSDGQ